MDQNHPLGRKDNIVVQQLEGELLIYDLGINKAFCLNQTSALIFQLCDGTRTVSEISRIISQKLKTLVNEDFVRLALDGLQKDNLLEKAEDSSEHFMGLSRREIVKKIGLASMVALPVIMHVTAPTAAQAQSGVCQAVTGLDECFCLDTFCDPVASFGMPVPPGSPDCQDGCLVGGGCSCKGPYICSQSIGIPGTGGKQGTCQF
jgi:hypothetical protein